MYTSLHDTGADENIEIEKIYANIEKLPQKRKEVFEKAYLDEKKSSDIAEELNISVRTVETHIYKALKFIRENVV